MLKRFGHIALALEHQQWQAVQSYFDEIRRFQQAVVEKRMTVHDQDQYNDLSILAHHMDDLNHFMEIAYEMSTGSQIGSMPLMG